MNGFGVGDALAGAWGSWMLAMTWQVALFAAIGYLAATRLKARDPKRFAAMGDNDWATGDPGAW